MINIPRYQPSDDLIMIAPFENSHLPPNVCLQIDCIQNNLASLEQVVEFIQNITQGTLQDNQGKVIDALTLCHYLLSNEIYYLHPELLNYIKRTLCFPQFDPALKTLCEHYSETSGLALYIMSFDHECNFDVAKRFQTLRQAAALNNANAMEDLYLFFSPYQMTHKGSVLNEEDLWKYLTQAAKFGSAYASVQLSKIYLGNGAIKVNINLNRALKALTRALPSSDGSVEYELFLLLEWGFRTDDGQMILADPLKAHQHLITATRKSDHEGMRQTLRRKEESQQNASLLPLNIIESLLRIQETKAKPSNIKAIEQYIDTFKSYREITPLLDFLISRHFIYLPPRIFRVLSNKLDSHCEKYAKMHLALQDGSSPLMKSLLYPISLFPQQNNPHAEYIGYMLYIRGGKSIGTKSDPSEEVKPSLQVANHYLQRAAENGHVNAQFVLGKQLLQRGQESTAVQLLNKACDQYDSSAMLTLANHYWSVFNSDRVRNFKIGQTAIHYYSMAREYGWRPDIEFEDRIKILANISQTAKINMPVSRNLGEITYTDESQQVDESSSLLSKKR